MTVVSISEAILREIPTKSLRRSVPRCDLVLHLRPPSSRYRCFSHLFIRHPILGGEKEVVFASFEAAAPCDDLDLAVRHLRTRPPRAPATTMTYSERTASAFT